MKKIIFCHVTVFNSYYVNTKHAVSNLIICTNTISRANSTGKNLPLLFSYNRLILWKIQADVSNLVFSNIIFNDLRFSQW
jgi:hypothetical protein